jgi:hypothetical protein
VEKDLQRFGGKTFWKRFLQKLKTFWKRIVQKFGEKTFFKKTFVEIWWKSFLKRFLQKFWNERNAENPLKNKNKF